MRLLARRPPPALTMAVGRRHPRLTPARYVPSPRQDPGALAPIDKEEKEGEEEEERGLDLLRSAIPFQYRILDVADACLADYCSTAPPEARERRLEVLRYYREKRAAAQRDCILHLEQQQQQLQQQQKGASFSAAAAAASSSSGADAAASSFCSSSSLAALSRMLYELSYSEPSALCHLLSVQRALEARAAAGPDAGKKDANHDTAASPAADAADDADAADALRARALRLFRLADADGDGRLDREEFLGSMRLVDAELTDAELGGVFSALGASARGLSAAQFVDAVTGEALLAAALCRASVDSDSERDEGEEEVGKGRAAARRGGAFLRRHVRARGGGGSRGGAGPAALARTADGGGCDADVLRRVRHSRPTWWSDSPGNLDLM